MSCSRAAHRRHYAGLMSLAAQKGRNRGDQEGSRFFFTRKNEKRGARTRHSVGGIPVRIECECGEPAISRAPRRRLVLVVRGRFSNFAERAISRFRPAVGRVAGERSGRRRVTFLSPARTISEFAISSPKKSRQERSSGAADFLPCIAGIPPHRLRDTPDEIRLRSQEGGRGGRTRKEAKLIAIT